MLDITREIAQINQDRGMKEKGLQSHSNKKKVRRDV